MGRVLWTMETPRATQIMSVIASLDCLGEFALSDFSETTILHNLGRALPSVCTACMGSIIPLKSLGGVQIKSSVDTVAESPKKFYI